MLNNLDKYRDYKQAVENLQTQTSTLKDFSYLLKNNPVLKSLRGKARTELQILYDHLGNDFGLKKLPVYLPIRKKIYVAGVTFHTGGIPSEVRIYSIKGSHNKSYDKWTPLDIRPYTEFEIFETFIHEAAHILEATRNGRMGHGKPFIKAYENIEEYFLNHGFENFIDPKLRLTGLPAKNK